MWRDLVSDKSASDLALQTSDGTQMIWKDDLAVITNDIHVNEQADTVKLMVVGPKRMQYEKIVSLMDFIGREIEKIYRK